MRICARQVWIAALVPLLLLLLAGAGPANAISGNAPDWWANPLPGSSNMRACWYEWDELWVNGDYPRGMSPDDWYIDFDVHPAYTGWEWDWSEGGEVQNSVVAKPEDPQQGDNWGIKIPAGLPRYEMDMSLGNRQLHPYKLWYVEIELQEEVEGDIARLKSENRFHPYTYAGKDLNDGITPYDWVEIPTDMGTFEILREGWDGNIWYAEYKITPQPDFEKILFEINTDSGDPLDGDLWMSRLCTGTMCTPEPVTVVLLALGLPLGILARRRKN